LCRVATLPDYKATQCTFSVICAFFYHSVWNSSASSHCLCPICLTKIHSRDFLSYPWSSLFIRLVVCSETCFQFCVYL
jgi:hypothetical protein